jgi:MFS family permease
MRGVFTAKSMKIIHDIILSRAPLIVLGMIGVTWGTFAARIPELKLRSGLSDAEFGLVLLGGAAAGMVAMALAPLIQEKMPRLCLPVSVAVMGVVIMPLGFAAHPVWFVITVAGAGMATGFADIFANARIAEIEASHNRGLMNLNHASYSAFYALSAVASGLAREAAISPEFWFASVAVIVAWFAVLTYTRDMPLPDAPSDGLPKKRFVDLGLILMGLVVLIAFFAENSTEGWSALHIERTLNGGAAEGALGPAMLGLTMAAGRFLGYLITVRGQEMRIITWAALVGSLGLMGAAWAPSPPLAYLGFALLGLGVSVVAPLALALVGQMAAPGRRARAVSFVAMIGYLGFFIGPPIVGFVSQMFGLRMAFSGVALAFVVIPLVVLPLIRHYRLS